MEKRNYHFEINKHKLELLLFIIIIGIWTLPSPLFIPTHVSGLDGSWIGINMAVSDDLQFGTDVAFTFGPLGFLYLPIYVNPNLWFLSLVFTLFVHFFFLFSLALLMVKSSANWKEYVLVSTIVLIPIHLIGDYKLILSVGIFLYLIVTHKLNRRYEMIVLSIVSLLLAIASLIKFNMAIASFSMILAFLSICIFGKEFKKYSSMFIFYITFVSILWVITGQRLDNLPIYLLNSYQFSSGYSDAMAINGPEWQIYIGLIGVTFIFILFLNSFIKRTDTSFVFILLNSGLLFLAFKHGFVRHDGHIYGFFAVYIIIFISLYIIGKDYTNFVPRVLILLLSILFIVSIYNGFPGIIEDNILQKHSTYELSLSLILNQSYQTQVLNDAKNSVRHDYLLDNNTIQYLEAKTVDIVPWDVDLIWAYNFNWSPRPIFQSYAAYTQDLDKLNAQHFSKENAPQAILYAYKSIDGRYPLFDEPSTFASILHNYSLIGKSGEFLLLSYNYNNNTLIEDDLGTVKVEIGQPINVPEYDSGYMFANIDLEYSTFGKFMKIIYKPALANIRFKFFDSTYSNEFRFIPRVPNNGVFISQYVGNIDDLASVFSGNITRDIALIIIDVDNPLYYKKYMEVKFVGVPANISIEKDSYSQIPDWHMLKRLPGGIGAIDYVGIKQYNEEIIVNIDAENEQFISISGWAADDKAKNGTVQTFLIFSDEYEEISVSTKKTLRPDVFKAFGVVSYEQSGWLATLRSKEFKNQCYNISLRILRANGEEYYELDGGKPICYG